jgi:quercetin dioxygenase-like cupin family protein
VFPESGFLLVALRAGKVTTTIGDKEEKHNTGDFWTVDAEAKMSVEVKGESAVLEVLSLAVR